MGEPAYQSDSKNRMPRYKYSVKMQNYVRFYVKRLGLRGILRGFLFVLIIVLPLTVFPWVLRKQLRRLERSSNSELWYMTNPNITAYLGFNDETSDCKYCRNATMICQSNKTDERGKEVAYFVLSYIKNQNQRNTIRRTWASVTSPRPVFVMGIDEDESQMIFATREADEYGDMIIENFADTFENSTLKTASILKHFKSFCGDVTYLMKTEDDVLVNADIVGKTVRRHINATLGALKILGYIHYEARVVRNTMSLWYVGHSMRKNPKYPTYASRMGYLIPGNRVADILKKSIEIPMIPVEDVYFTGLLAAAVGLHHTMDTTFNAQAVRVKNYCTMKPQSVIYAPNPLEMKKLWSTLQLKNPSVCFTFWNRLIMQIFT